MTNAKKAPTWVFFFVPGAIALTFVEAVFKLPKIERVLSEMLNGQALPAIVIWAIKLSRFIQNYWWLALAILLLFLICTFLWRKRGLSKVWIALGIVFSVAYIFMRVGRFVGGITIVKIVESLQGKGL